MKKPTSKQAKKPAIKSPTEHEVGKYTHRVASMATASSDEKHALITKHRKHVADLREKHEAAQKSPNKLKSIFR